MPVAGGFDLLVVDPLVRMHLAGHERRELLVQHPDFQGRGEIHGAVSPYEPSSCIACATASYTVLVMRPGSYASSSQPRVAHGSRGVSHAASSWEVGRGPRPRTT